MDKIIVKIFPPNSHQSVLKTFRRTEINIGRGFHNDLILDDSYVSELHAKVSLVNGQLEFQDEKSLNGVVDDLTKKKLDNGPLRSGQTVMMGSTKLIFYLSDHELGITKSFKERRWYVKVMNHPLFALVGFLVLFLCAGAEAFIGIYEKQKWLLRLTSVAFNIGAVFVWAGFWSFITYLLRRKMHFVMHLSTMCFYGVCYYVVGATCSILRFNLGDGFFYTAVEGLAYAAVTCFLLVRTLRVASRISTKRAVILSCIVAAAFNLAMVPIGKTYYTKLKRRTPHYTGLLYPKHFKIMPSQSLKKWRMAAQHHR